LSAWESGTLDIVVNGSNGSGQGASASQEVALLDNVVPRVTEISVTSGVPILDNQPVSVRVTFSERVDNVEANVGGTGITFVAQDAASTVWEGSTSGAVTVNANEMTKTVSVTRYQDTQSNSGDYSQSYNRLVTNVKPVVAISPRVGSIDQTESSQWTISGTARGFDNSSEKVVTVVGSLRTAP
ncbi:hypothetical protein, partial [Vibrio coralliilyticus]|uniref:hypothetical protein n=1 Tax=Vibrio coralliilyticus TaxID=190893 RepID=UPI0015D4C925